MGNRRVLQGEYQKGRKATEGDWRDATENKPKGCQKVGGKRV